MTSSSLFSNKYFACYLVILCWAPLPIGSNRTWLFMLLSLLCFCLVLGLLFQSLKDNINLGIVLKPYKIPLLIFMLTPLWISLQCFPLPADIVAWLSPGSAQIHSQASNSLTSWFSLSLEPGKTQQMAVLSWAYFIFFVLTLLLVDRPSRLRKLMMVIVVCGVFQAVYGGFMVLSGLKLNVLGERISSVGVATGTYINRNHLAGYLEMCLAVGIGLLVSSLGDKSIKGWRNHLKKFLDTMLGPKLRLRLFLAIMVSGLVLTRSRMGNTAFFLSLPLCGVAMMILQRRISKQAIILFLSLLIVDFVIVGQWFGFEKLVKRMQSSSLEAETRDEVVRDSWLMLQDYPLTGTGAGTFYSSFPSYRDSDIGVFYYHAHNDYIEFSSTLGLLGFLPLVSSVLFAMLVAAQTLFRRRDSLAKGAAFACIMGITSLLIHSAVDFNLHIPANALLFILLMALAYVSSLIPAKPDRRSDY